MDVYASSNCYISRANDRKKLVTTDDHAQGEIDENES